MKNPESKFNYAYLLTALVVLSATIFSSYILLVSYGSISGNIIHPNPIGACLSTSVDLPAQYESLCIDTDSGKFTCEAGQVKMNQEIFVDTCLSQDSLKEYYCPAKLPFDKPQSAIVKCKYGCENGACKKSA